MHVQLIGPFMMQTKTETASLARFGGNARVALWEKDDSELRAVADILDSWFPLKLLDTIPEPGDATGTILLLCRSPVEFICQAMDRDETPAAALADWQARVRPALTLNRRNRSKVHLIDAGALRRDPAGFLQYCGLPEKDGAIAALSALAGALPDPVLQALAQQALYADIVSRSLASEFEAVVVNLQADGAAVGDETGVLFRAYRKRHDEQRELELLRDQQRDMYEQMEALYAEKMQTEQRLDQLNGGLESYQAQVDALQAAQQDIRTQLAAREGDIEGLRGRIAAKEQVLQAAGSMLQGLEQARDALEQANRTLREEVRALQQQQSNQENRIEMLQVENQQIINSISYRFMAPLRRMRLAIRGGGR